MGATHKDVIKMIRKAAFEKKLRNYLKENAEVKEICREFVFNTYLDKSDWDFEYALDQIRGDMYILERLEQYERCQILKDILTDFE